MYLTPAPVDALLIQAQAEQFAYYFRYPGADGKLGPMHLDKIDDASENYFGLDRKADPDSRDDIISLSIHFVANQAGRYEIMCTQLCGLGHYDMKSYLLVLSQADFDHKVIGQQYFALALVAVLTGMVLSWLMRMHVAWPDVPIPGLRFQSGVGAAGGVVTPEYYLSLMTLHGTLMIFFVLTNGPFAAFGTCLLPIQVGSRETAFPRCNAPSFWMTFFAFCVGADQSDGWSRLRALSSATGRHSDFIQNPAQFRTATKQIAQNMGIDFEF
jgi:hypothetical protein